MKNVLKVRKIDENAVIPEYATEGSVGLDLRAIAAYNIPAGTTQLVKTGLAVEVPYGYVGAVCSRSGLALKKSLFVLNSPGIIDPDYRGNNDEICAILHNAGKDDFEIAQGDRIAQLVLMPAPQFTIVEVDNLNETDRGGLGSTGVK